MRKAYIALVAASLLAAAVMANSVWAVPAFKVEDIGFGVPDDVNASGTIVGQDGFAPAQPWVLQGNGKFYLPMPAGVTQAITRRINDQGVVAGEAAGRAVVWWPEAGGYVLEELPIPQGATVGRAVNVNASGVVLVTYGTPGRLVTGYEYMSWKPYLYTRQGGLVDLSLRYALPAYPDPVDLTDGGRILLKSGEILEPNGSVTPTPAFPERTEGSYSWLWFAATRMNESGAFIGVAILSSSMDYAQAVRYTPGVGWKVLGGLSLNVTAHAIDAAGDALSLVNYICPINYGLAYSPAAGGTYCMDDLVLGGGWSFLGMTAKGALSSGVLLSDGTVSPHGMVAALGYSEAAGTSRLARLMPAGELPAPPAVSLAAAPHPATYTQPYNSITLSWSSGGTLAKAYDVERKGPGETEFARLARVSAATLRYEDTSVAPLTVYAYRIAAVGLAGSGPYSNQAGALSPAAMDREAPTATITSPAEGAAVTGVVTVSATFSDNVGVVYATLSYTPTVASGVICQNAPSAPVQSLTLSCKWDSSKVAYQSSSATVYAYGHDAIGNWVQKTVSVNVTYSGGKGGGKPRRK